MIARLGDLRCLSCGHDPDSYNPVCGCATCHNVFAGSSVPAPTSSLAADGGGRNPVVPARHISPSTVGRDRTYPASSWGWWLAAAVSLMVVGFGALHGWHTTPVDTVVAVVLPLVLILGGVFWPEKGGRS